MGASRRLSLVLLLAVLQFAYVEGDFLQSFVDFFVGPKNPESTMTITEIITSHGYPVESHSVTTEDGYILAMQRIPYGKSGQNGTRPVAFLLHAFLTTSIIWVWSLPKNNLAYILADAGYDVWMGNIRGNAYCLNHTSLKTTDPEFWNFGLDEMALIDLPTMTDYVLETTGAKKMTFAALSMGTAIVSAMLADKTEYNEKFKAVVLLAPPIKLKHMKSPLKYITPGWQTELLKSMKHGEMPLFSNIFDNDFCRHGPMTGICSWMFFQLFGPEGNQFNQSRNDILFRFFPSPTSVKVLEHFLQILNAQGRFAKYDYGGSENVKKYGQDTSPVYDLTKITAPVAIFAAENDWLADLKDVEPLKSEFQNLLLYHKVEYPEFSHCDFVFGTDVDTLVYEPLMKALKNQAP